jgi:hypothetical protein
MVRKFSFIPATLESFFCVVSNEFYVTIMPKCAEFLRVGQKGFNALSR